MGAILQAPKKSYMQEKKKIGLAGGKRGMSADLRRVVYMSRCLNVVHQERKKGKSLCTEYLGKAWPIRR